MVLEESLPLETVGIIVIFSLILSLLLKRLGQNAVLGFILAGFLLGPFALNFLRPDDLLVKVFAELGLFVLLFYLGIELSFKEFLKAGVPTFSLAIADMIALGVIGFVISYIAGFSLLFSLAVAVMLFSHSSAIVGKFILDKGLIKEKSAQMALAILILEDFLGILILVFISSLSNPDSALSLAMTSVVFAVVSFYAVHRVSSVVEKFLTDKNVSSTELTLYGLGIGLIVATLASFLKLSPALGAYFAGFALSEFKVGEKVKHELEFLREFFLLFFFVSFGTSLFFNHELQQIVIPPIDQLGFIAGLALLLSLAIVFVNAIIFTVIGPLFGLTNKDSSEIAVFLTPLGEFVIIITITVLPALGGGEALFLSPIAFLMIVFTLLIFQPLYNLLGLHDKLTQKIPAFAPRHKEEKPIKPFTSESRQDLHDIGLNLIIIVGLVWITILLYEAIPTTGLEIPFGRTISAGVLFFFFVSIPLINLLRAAKKLLTHSLSKEVTIYLELDHPQAKE